MSVEFPVYQIDFSAVAAGKRVAATKRRIRWRFGFPNQAALADGKTGIECRGEEHEIVIVWSVTSGKRQIIMDGREVHFSNTRTSLMDHTWSGKGNHVMKVLCHASAPMSANPGFRQYDFFIDGQSFFRMPKVYELGVRPGSSASPRGGGYDGGYGPPPPRAPAVRSPSTLSQEDAELQAAINASLEESRRRLGPRAGSSGGGSLAPPAADLLDMGAEPSPAPPEAYSQSSYDQGQGGPPPPPNYGAQSTQPSYSYGGTTVAPGANSNQQFLALPSSSNYPPPQQQQYTQGPTSPPQQQQYNQGPPPPQQQYYDQSYGQQSFQSSQGYGSPGPSPNGGGDPLGLHTAEDPFAPKPPRREDLMSDVLKAYQSPSPVTPSSGNYGSPAPQYPGQQLSLSNGLYNGDEESFPQNGSTPMSMNALVSTEEEPLNPFDAALKKLVNFDHIDEPAEEQLKLTMKQKEEETSKKSKNKSKPLPPAAQNMVGSSASLSQIQQVKPQSTPKKEVMKPPPQLFHADAHMAGALVVHGQGPPPLQPQGFGVVHNGGFGYAAQQPPMYQQAPSQQYYQQPPPQPSYQQAPPSYQYQQR
jgi:hypothetical protein